MSSASRWKMEFTLVILAVEFGCGGSFCLPKAIAWIRPFVVVVVVVDLRGILEADRRATFLAPISICAFRRKLTFYNLLPDYGRRVHN